MSSRRIGNYQIIDYIGSGGFGSVFKAEDVNTPGRIIAIKELHKKHTRNSSIKQRFFQEAIAMARLDHPNLPRLYTFGEDNGSYYLVMEFLSGHPLSERIQLYGALDLARALAVLAQVLEGVSYAHRAGIIHRDLKPDNVFLIDEGDAVRVKVLDFGIARIVGGENLTLTGESFGTPNYMSPERITGSQSIDQRTDIYALGIILFEMLTGRAPFESTATDPALYWSEMRARHENEPLPPMASFGVPAEIERIANKAAAKRIEDRYTTADEMLADLHKLEIGEGAGAIGKQSASLSLATVPGAADVFVDNISRGVSGEASGRILIDGLAPGLHSVRVSKPGYSDYRISVSLESSRQTDLQVALAARATMAMPQIEETGPVDATTIKMETGDEAATALFVVDGIPSGSTVFVGSKAVALAGDDGRATIKLDPGVHEIQVTAPSGAGAKRMVTVTGQDTGSFTTIKLPLEPASVVTRPMSSADGGKRRLAAAAAVAILLALVVVAYFVLRGPERGQAQAEEQTIPGMTETDDADRNEQQNAEPQQRAAEAAQRAAEADQRESEAQQRAAEAEARRIEEVIAAEKRAAEKETQNQGAPPPPAPAVTPEPPRQPPAQTDACLDVLVLGPTGDPLPRVRVAAFSEGGLAGGLTDASGKWERCGVTPGKMVRVEVMGMGRGKLGTSQRRVESGRNEFVIRVNRNTQIRSPQDRPPRQLNDGQKRPGRFRRP
jgi:tRNA A-37 threonylcarbamoyl transferase component Bud32